MIKLSWQGSLLLAQITDTDDQTVMARESSSRYGQYLDQKIAFEKEADIIKILISNIIFLKLEFCLYFKPFS
jgi:hypothetical protein